MTCYTKSSCKPRWTYARHFRLHYFLGLLFLAAGILQAQGRERDPIKIGPAEINLTTYMGISQVPQQGRPHMMNAQEFASYQRDRIAQGVRRIEGREAVESDFPIEYQNLKSIGENNNWYDLILPDALMQNYHLSIQQASDKSQFY